MKKISTLLLACATVATASAAGFSFNRQASIADVAKYNTPVKVENTELKADMVRRTLHAKSNVSRAGMDIAGNWVGFYYDQSSLYGINSFNLKPDGNDYIVSNFWNQLPSEKMVLKDCTATFGEQEMEFSDGTYTMDVLTIIGGGETVVGNYDGKDVFLVLSEYTTSGFKLYSNDIAYVYDEDYGAFWWPYREGIGVAFCTEGQEEGYYSILDFYEINEIDYANATLTGNRKVSETESLNYSNAFIVEDISDNETEDQFGCIGFAGCDGIPMFYMENGETIFYGQTAGTIYYNSTSYDIMICTTPDGENLTAEVVGELTEDGAKKISTFDNMIFFCPDIPATYMWLEDVVLTIGENGAGISNVAADVDNSNAPVVYYNLQGQLVKEPAAGQIVIRKQGTEATKVLVK